MNKTINIQHITKYTLLLLTLSFSTLIQSCGSGASSSVSSIMGGGESTLLSDAKQLKEAQEELMKMPKYEGKDVQVFQNIQFFTVAGGKIIIELQDPSKPENIDHYEYMNGKWSDASPVQISGEGDMKDNLTPLKEIDFTTVEKINNVWSTKAKTVEGAEKKPLDLVIYNFIVESNDKFWITSDIEGSREKYSATFNKDGSLREYIKK